MIGLENLVSAFGQTEVKNGDTIMVHSSYKSLGGVEGGAETVIDAFLELVGPDGSVIFPTFNFQSWTETHYFDIKETPSAMGIIGELARQRKAAIRTPHPIYSFAVLGNGKEEFLTCDDKEAFGDNSPTFRRPWTTLPTNVVVHGGRDPAGRTGNRRCQKQRASGSGSRRRRDGLF
ncbi:MAG: AAC(3) family N-acetyltransferase [Bacteroidota bacterium]